MLDEQFRKLLENNITCYAYEYEFYYNLENVIAKPRNFTKIAGRITRIVNDKELTLSDHSGNIDVYIDSLDLNIVRLLNEGDIVGVAITYDSSKDKFIANDLTLLTKTRIGIDYKNTNKDYNLKYRHLSHINDKKIAKNIQLRSKTLSSLRKLLADEGFMEIDTPLLHPFQGDSTSRPIFAETATYDGLRFALASSPELYLKKLLVSGFNKVFTINKVFRDEEIDRTHLMEFTSVEYYMAYVDYKYMMDFTEKLLKKLAKEITGKSKITFMDNVLDFSKPWKRISIHDTLLERFGKDLYVLDYNELIDVAKMIDIEYSEQVSPGNIIIDIFEKLYLSSLIQPTFIYDFPKDASVMCYDITMAKDHRNNNLMLERFELYLGGMELANCYSELNDPEAQKQAFDRFLTRRNKELTMDETFYHALRVGMPPAGGVGFGIDRLLMILTNSSDIIDVVPFSTYHESQKIN